MEVERAPAPALPRVRELSFNLRPRRGCAGSIYRVAVIRVAGSVLPRDGLASGGNVR